MPPDAILISFKRVGVCVFTIQSELNVTAFHLHEFSISLIVVHIFLNKIARVWNHPQGCCESMSSAKAYINTLSPTGIWETYIRYGNGPSTAPWGTSAMIE